MTDPCLVIGLFLVITSGAVESSLPAKTASRRLLQVNDDEWQCGKRSVSKWISEKLLNLSCESLRGDVNRCCIHHDNCYDDRSDKGECDNIFCICIEDAMRSSSWCHRVQATLFCWAVKYLEWVPFLR
uniref:Uncharacterized protein n=1 Tax=Plectus sambesii TaxID=2011161 RepID=A0A914X9D8_9BILA